MCWLSYFESPAVRVSSQGRRRLSLPSRVAPGLGAWSLGRPHFPTLCSKMLSVFGRRVQKQETKSDPAPGKTTWAWRDSHGPEDTYLPTTGFDHEFSGQVGSWLWLQGADDNALVQRVTRYNLKGKAVSELPGREARCFSRMLVIPLEAWRWAGQRGRPCRGGRPQWPGCTIFLPASGGRQTRKRPGPACEFADQSQSQKSQWLG